MGPLGWQEMAVIGILALVLFGPKRLPELARNVGKAMAEFRRAKDELKSTFDTHMRELERENASLRETTHQFTSEIQNSYYGSYEDSSYYDSGAYGTESHDTASSEPSPVSVSAPQDAEPTQTALPPAADHQPSVDHSHSAPTTPATEHHQA